MRTEPGEALPEPLVVRLEDQFGNPVVGEAITAIITRGEGSFIEADVITDGNGEARFAVQVGASTQDLVVQVITPDISEVKPLNFFAIIGELDTLDFPRDIAVADDVAFVADRDAGLLIIDVQDSAQPTLLHTIALKKAQTISPEARSLEIQGTHLYMGTAFSAALYIVDISAPRSPDFAADRDGDGVADVVLTILDFTEGLSVQARDAATIEDVAVHGDRVYALSNTFSTEPATLFVVDVQDRTEPQILSTTILPTPDPSGLVALGDLVYVAAEEAGLLVFDVSNPTAPALVDTLRDPEPNDDVEVALRSGILLEDTFAYVVETQRDQSTNASTDVFTVLDLSTPELPRRRGSIQLTTRPQLPLTRTGLTVSGAFAYVGRGVFGLEALDIRDPDRPRRVGFVDTPSEVLQVTTAETFLYVLDSVFGLQVIQGPGLTETDTDGDGVIDFFDAFPTDSTETRDSDDDRVGDNADVDDDNDGFTDAEEVTAMPPTVPTDPLSFPVRAPPTGVTTMLVDVATRLAARDRQGTQEAPYRSISEALQALHSGLAPDVDTLRVRTGIYSPFTTQERIPLDLSRLSHLRMQAEVPGSAILDGTFRGNVINAEFSEGLVIEGFVVTHGANGLSVQESKQVTIRDNQIRDNDENGILLGPNVDTSVEVIDNLVEDNGDFGVFLSGNVTATLMRNTVRRNEVHGIFVAFSSTAEIHDNIVEQNDSQGISVLANSTVTISGNTVAQNRFGGVVIFDNSTATVTHNTVRENRNNGIVTDVRSTSELRDNIIVGNGFTPNPDFPANLPVGNGVIAAGGSVVTVGDGNVITENRVHGIHVFLSPLNPEPATALVGLDPNTTIEISKNGRAGIFVEDDGSEATIDSRNIIFDGNAEGDTAGNVIDVAPGP